jgi:hypothetical protein
VVYDTKIQLSLPIARCLSSRQIRRARDGSDFLADSTSTGRRAERALDDGASLSRARPHADVHRAPHLRPVCYDDLLGIQTQLLGQRHCTCSIVVTRQERLPGRVAACLGAQAEDFGERLRELSCCADMTTCTCAHGDCTLPSPRASSGDVLGAVHWTTPLTMPPPSRPQHLPQELAGLVALDQSVPCCCSCRSVILLLLLDLPFLDSLCSSSSSRHYPTLHASDYCQRSG